MFKANFILSLCFSLLFNSQNYAQSFINGDFSNGTYTCTGPPGWISNGNVQMAEIYQIGNFWIDITGCGNGNKNWIEQEITLIPGEIYYIQLDLGTWEGWDDMDAGVDITLDGVQLGNRIYHDSFTHRMDMRLQWMTRQSCAFQAVKDKVKIRITGNSVCTATSPQSSCQNPNPGVIAIDNIILKKFNSGISATVCSGLGYDTLRYSPETSAPPHTISWWKNGQKISDDTFFVSQGFGKYILKFDFGCNTATQEFEIGDQFESKQELSFCPYETFLYKGKQITRPGNYKDTLYNLYGCDSIVTYVVSFKTAPSLGQPTYKICDLFNDSVVLKSPVNSPVKWMSTGDTSLQLKVRKSGEYFYIYTYEQTCRDTQSIQVLNNCNRADFIPNAFSPNGDGHNEVFLPLIGEVDYFRMMIFNRWGEKLYDSGLSQEGWDGTYMGEACPESVYLYLINYTKPNNRQGFVRNGTLTLLR